MAKYSISQKNKCQIDNQIGFGHLFGWYFARFSSSLTDYCKRLTSSRYEVTKRLNLKPFLKSWQTKKYIRSAKVSVSLSIKTLLGVHYKKENMQYIEQ